MLKGNHSLGQKSQDSDKELLSSYLHDEMNQSMKKGDFISSLFGFLVNIFILIMIAFDLVKDLLPLLILGSAAGMYAILIHILARKKMVRGLGIVLALLPLIISPTIYFLLIEQILPDGAATHSTVD